MPPPVRLRAHQVLCLQGFRGLGYSPAFVQAFTALHEALRGDPQREIELLTAPDDLCQVCPHLRASGCTLGGPDHEQHMRLQDEDVLVRLDLAAGVIVTWAELLDRLRASLRSSDLPEVCTTCPWLPLGYCAKGMDQLEG